MRRRARALRVHWALLVGLTVAAAVPADGRAQEPAPATSPPASMPTRPTGPPKRTWARALTEAARPTPGGVRYQLSVTETEVGAATIEEFTARMRAAGTAMLETRSGRSPGSYQWAISTPWETEMDMGRCQFKRISVLIELDVDVIALAGPVAADSAARASWDRQLDAQWAGHVARLRMMRDAARTLHQEVRLLSNSSCAEITTRANDLARAARAAIAERLRGMGGRTAPPRDPGGPAPPS
jgi:hypothetical protein